MTSSGDELESLRQISVFFRQTIRLHLIELVIKSAQEGQDYLPIVKSLSIAASKASGNPIDLPISELEAALFSHLDSR